MSSRRTPGLSAFSARTSLSTSYATHGTALRAQTTTSLSTQLSVFRSLLHNFALTHAATIRSDPTFRQEFARMCAAVGVDPAAGVYVKGGGRRGGKWWGGLGGGGSGVESFYAEVAVRVVEVCRRGRGEGDGGLIEVGVCRERVGRGSGLGGEVVVSDDDILRAVKSLKPLGSGFSIVTVGSKQMIRSIPKELNTDQSTVLEAIQVLGYVTCSMLEDNLGWEHARAETVIGDLLGDSLVWVDLQSLEKEYWSPAFMNDFED